MSADRCRSECSSAIQTITVTIVAITTTFLCSLVLAQGTLGTDWLNFRSSANAGQLAIFNDDPFVTLQGATFSAKDRTGALITQGSFPPIAPGRDGTVAFTLSGPGAVMTINVPSGFNLCNLHPSLVVIPDSVTGPAPVDQFPESNFARLNRLAGPSTEECQRIKRELNKKFGRPPDAALDTLMFAPPNTSQLSTNMFFDLHNPTLTPQVYTFGVYNPATGQFETPQTTTVGPDQVVRQPVTFSGFGIPFVCGDGSLVSPTFTIEQTFAVGSQTHTELLQVPDSRITVTVRNPNGI